MIADVAIVGGGIAAAAAALALEGKCCAVQVGGRCDSGRQRIGEVLSPSASAILRRLGVWERFHAEGHQPVHTTYSSWGSDLLIERNSIVNPEGPGWLLDRERFESFLWSCAEGSLTDCIAALVQVAQRNENGWRLEFRDGGSLDARFVLDCSGPAAAVARHLTDRQRDDRLIAAYSFLEHVDSQVRPTPAILIEARPDGWWYSSLIPDGRLVVAYFSDQDLMPRRLRREVAVWRKLINGSVYTRARIETAGFLVRQPPSMADASSRRLATAVGERWAAAGDAAPAFDPASSHGITTALWSGEKAASAVLAMFAADPAPLRQYADSMAAGTVRYRLQLQQVYGRERRFAERPFWSRRKSAKLTLPWNGHDRRLRTILV